jgi:hypothetical protein
MKKLLLLSFALVLGVSVSRAEKLPFGKKKGIREVILVKMKKDIPPAQRKELETLISDLKSNTKTVESVEWGRRVDYNGVTKEYDRCLLLKFRNDNDFEIFQANPVRMRLLGKLMALSDKILQFSYKIE